MKIIHHPADELIDRFATGRLAPAEHVVLAVHISLCASCRRLTLAFEELGGQTLETGPVVEMNSGAFERALDALDDPVPKAGKVGASAADDAIFGPLPASLKRYDFGKSRTVAPGVSLRPILLPEGSQSRAFLLKSAAGVQMLDHSHTGTELTCVLSGRFSHEGGFFGPGDFDFGDGDTDHRPIVGPEAPCVCLVSMSGDLRPNGWLGKLIGPFVRI